MATNQATARPLTGLTAFRRDLLRAVEVLETVNNEPPSGADMQRFLEDSYEDVKNGRMYPAIDQLVRDGLIEKSAKDRRANQHRLTEKGRERLEEHRAFYTETKA